MFQYILRYPGRTLVSQGSLVITQVFLGDEPNVKLKSREEREALRVNLRSFYTVGQFISVQ